MVEITQGKVRVLSRMVHEANRAYCDEMGDTSQKPWNEAPGYNHTSAMVGIQAVIDNPDISPSDLHDVWMNAKKEDGWVYGPTKDKKKKTHPSIVPFDDLSASEKYKDWLVIYTVKSYTDFCVDAGC